MNIRARSEWETNGRKILVFSSTSPWTTRLIGEEDLVMWITFPLKWVGEEALLGPGRLFWGPRTAKTISRF